MTISHTAIPIRTDRPLPVATTEQDGLLFAGLHILAARTAQGDRQYGRVSDTVEPTDRHILTLLAATWAATDARGAYVPLDRGLCDRLGITGEIAVVLGALAGLAPDALAGDECFRIYASGYRRGWDSVVRSFWEGATLHACAGRPWAAEPDLDRTSITVTLREPGNTASVTVPVRATPDARGRFIGSTHYVVVEEEADTYSDTALIDALSTASAQAIDALLECHIRASAVTITGREWRVTVCGDRIEAYNSLSLGQRSWQDFRTNDPAAADELYTVTGKFLLASHDYRSGHQSPAEQIRGVTIDQIIDEARFRFVVAEVAKQRLHEQWKQVDSLRTPLSDAAGEGIDRAF